MNVGNDILDVFHENFIKDYHRKISEGQDRITSYVFSTGIGAYSVVAFDLVVWAMEDGREGLLEVARRVENRCRVAHGVAVVN